MAGKNNTFLLGPKFEHPDGDNGPRAREHARHAANHSRTPPHPSTGLKHVDPRVGAPKNDHFAPINQNMTRQQQTMAGVGGMGHAVQVQGGGHAITDSKNAMPHAYHPDALDPSKAHPKLQRVPNYPGQRSRNEQCAPERSRHGARPSARTAPQHMRCGSSTMRSSGTNCRWRSSSIGTLPITLMTKSCRNICGTCGENKGT